MFREPQDRDAWRQENDPRRRVCAQVHDLATAVSNSSECSQLYGVHSTTKLVNGTVVEVIVGKTATGRSSTSLKVLWKLWRRKAYPAKNIFDFKLFELFVFFILFFPVVWKEIFISQHAKPENYLF